MRRFLNDAFRLALLVLACAGCAAPPPVHFHTLLQAEPPVHREGAPVASNGPAIVLEPVKVPAQVDQPQWLIRLPDDTLAMFEQERWASPLRDELQQALLERLTQRFGAVDARSSATGAALWRIRVEVTRFESRPGEARLDSTWVIAPRGLEAPVLRCMSSLRESAGAGMPALAEAHRRALARLGDAIGEQLLALQRGERARCPV